MGLKVSDSFSGNWNLWWVAGRYASTFRRGLTPRKAWNVGTAMMEMARARPHVRSLPFMMRLEPTSTCNLRCPRCSTGLGIDPRPKGFLSTDDLAYLLDQVSSHVVLVRLDGDGEPLLHPRITECIQMIKRAGMAVNLSTHMNREPRGGWESFVDAGVDRVVAAIDGATQDVYERYRVGGTLSVAKDNIARLVHLRARRRTRYPLIELQFLDWGYNHHQISSMREMAQELGVDLLKIIRPDAGCDVRADPLHPKRCFWLWCVLTLDWQLKYRSCTNAWTYDFPGLDARTTPPAEYWNSEPLVEARKFNKDKNSAYIRNAPTCLCNRCTDMLVVDRPAGYVCE